MRDRLLCGYRVASAIDEPHPCVLDLDSSFRSSVCAVVASLSLSPFFHVTVVSARHRVGHRAKIKRNHIDVNGMRSRYRS